MTRRRGEWTEICRELKEKTILAKRETWRKQLEKIREERNAERQQSMECVKQMKGQRSENHGGAMLYRSKWRTTPKAKANAFIQEYAEISSGKSTKRTRKEKVSVASHLRKIGPRREIEKDLTIVELKQSVRALKNGKPLGSDGIRPQFLKHLPDVALNQVLTIANHSWRTYWVPQQWRSAIIIPILKKEKDASKVESYRPIALTSQLGKCIEKIIGGRLTWWLEENGKISPYHAGFRKGRSTTNQCLRLSHQISDGFQAKPPQRTLLTLFDYSRAFDTLRRSAQLEKMLKKEVPETLMTWVRSWLSNRIVRVRVEDSKSRSHVMREGAPQGAVLPPLLFITFLDNLLYGFAPDTLVSAYADDLALAVSGNPKEETERRMQTEVDKVVRWSRDSGLALKIGKCESCLFTPSTAEFKWSPTLTIEGQTIKDTQHPRFLGITYDKMLTFNRHTDEVVMQFEKNTFVFFEKNCFL